MRNINSKSEIITVIMNIIKREKDRLYHVFYANLVDKDSKMTLGEVQELISGRKASHEEIEKYPVEILVWIYETLLKYNDKLKPLDYYFEEREINAAKVFQIKRVQAQFPLKLKVLDKPDPYHEDYLMSLSIKFLNSMQENGVIQLDPEMQRESEITSYRGQLVSHISFDPEAASEIGDSMANYTYRADMIRLLLVEDGEEDYAILNNEIVIKKGNIALIDGNHRLKGSELALLRNDTVELKLPVMFTIGTVLDGKFIIKQSEKRRPLNTELLKTFDISTESSIVRGLEASLELDPVYKFCKTHEEIKKGVGFVLSSILINSVKKHYDMKGISKNQENKIKSWLVEFFNELADKFYSDFENFQSIKKQKWNATPYAFAGYIYLSSQIQNKSNWKEIIGEVLSKIDFYQFPWTKTASNQDKVVLKVFEEVITDVLG